MKDIWKLLLVALMALAIVGCPTTKNDDEGEDEVPSTVDAQNVGVYSYTGKISEISTCWGGNSDAPAFTIYLLDDDALEYVSETAEEGNNGTPKGVPVGSPVYQVKVDNNISMYTAEDGLYYCVTGEKEYPCVAALRDTTNDTYTVYFDMSKLTRTVFFGMGKDWSDADPEFEHQFTANEGVRNVTGWNVLIAGIDSTTANPVAEFWSAKCYNMTKIDNWPDNVQHPPKKVKFSVELKGELAVGLFADPTSDATADATWTISLKEFPGTPVALNIWADADVRDVALGTVTENAVFKYTTPNPLTPAGWEMSNSGENKWPKALADTNPKYVKKIKVGSAEFWCGFKDATDSFEVK